MQKKTKKVKLVQLKVKTGVKSGWAWVEAEISYPYPKYSANLL